MYSRDGSVREEMSWDRKGPSFSSTLLDEIYRSIDEGTARKDCNGFRKKQDEEEAMQRSKLLDKWMKKKMNSEENSKRSKMEFDNDALFFSSGSNSSDSTNSSLFSEHESITVKTKSSCFLPPKPIRTSKKTERRCNETEIDDVVPASAKSRALKLYAHLKKMKQPISPGVKLTTFINSILSNSKKHSKRETTTSADTKPTCSSASSFTRSCLKQQTTSSRRVDSIKTFVPVNVVVNAYPMTLKRHEQERQRRQLIDSNRVSPKPNSIMQSKPVNVAEDEDDAASECSEDLFELDHLKLSRFSAELPVYETTQVSVPSRVSLNNSNM
ncbi:hypothetical protein QQ045_027605 [Rhodiola kirilowii]